MCEPTTIAAVTTVVSAAFTANQQRQEGKFQKGVADYNARVADNEAQKTREAGVERENIQRRKTAELLARQRAQLGAANVELTSGTPLQLQEETIALGEADALRIRSNFEQRAQSLETGAVLTRQQGEFAESAGETAAFGTLLKSTSKVLGSGVADKWLTPDSAALQPLTTNLTGGQSNLNVGAIT